jgi:hypothetical protein
MRILYRVISPDRTLHSFCARDSERPAGQQFDRVMGESDEAFEARVFGELGWGRPND